MTNGVRFSIYLRKEQQEWLDREAEKAGLSRSKFIEQKVFPENLQVMINKVGNYSNNGAKKKGAEK